MDNHNKSFSRKICQESSMGKTDKSKLKEKDTYKVFGHKVNLIPWDQVPFKGYKDEDNQNVVTIEASVVTGFECAALEEVKSKLKIDNVQEFMGRIGNVQLLTNLTSKKKRIFVFHLFSRISKPKFQFFLRSKWGKYGSKN